MSKEQEEKWKEECQIATMRAAFEKQYAGFQLTRDGEGYFYTNEQDRWDEFKECWEAAKQSSQAEIDALTIEVNALRTSNTIIKNSWDAETKEVMAEQAKNRELTAKVQELTAIIAMYERREEIWVSSDVHVAKVQELSGQVDMLRYRAEETKGLLAASMHEHRPLEEYEQEINDIDEAISATSSSNWRKEVQAQALEDFKNELHEKGTIVEAALEYPWLPISCATKKDYVRILLGRVGYSGYTVGWWDSRRNYWSTGPSPMDYFAEPTHWMPIPELRSKMKEGE